MNRKTFLLAACGLPFLGRSLQASEYAYHLKTEVFNVDAEGQNTGRVGESVVHLKPGVEKWIFAEDLASFTSDWTSDAVPQPITSTLSFGARFKIRAIPDRNNVRLHWSGDFTRLVGPDSGFLLTKRAERLIYTPQVSSAQRAGETVVQLHKPRFVDIALGPDRSRMQLKLTLEAL